MKIVLEYDYKGDQWWAYLITKGGLEMTYKHGPYATALEACTGFLKEIGEPPSEG